MIIARRSATCAINCIQQIGVRKYITTMSRRIETSVVEQVSGIHVVNCITGSVSSSRERRRRPEEARGLLSKRGHRAWEAHSLLPFIIPASADGTTEADIVRCHLHPEQIRRHLISERGSSHSGSSMPNPTGRLSRKH